MDGNVLFNSLSTINAAWIVQIIVLYVRHTVYVDVYIQNNASNCMKKMTLCIKLEQSMTQIQQTSTKLTNCQKWIHRTSLQTVMQCCCILFWCQLLSLSECIHWLFHQCSHKNISFADNVPCSHFPISSFPISHFSFLISHFLVPTFRVTGARVVSCPGPSLFSHVWGGAWAWD